MIHVERILMIECLLYDPRGTHTDDRVFATIYVERILLIVFCAAQLRGDSLGYAV